MSIVFVKPTVYELILRDSYGVIRNFSVKANSLFAAREFAIECLAFYAGELDRSTYEFSIRTDRGYDDTTSVLIDHQEVDNFLLTRAKQEPVLGKPTIHMSLNCPECDFAYLIHTTKCSFKEAKESMLNQLAEIFDDPKAFKTCPRWFEIEVYDLSTHAEKEFTISRLEVELEAELRRDRLLKNKGGKQA